MVKNNFSYEDVYALKIMAFEKDMAKQNRRPPLPQRRETIYSYANKSPAAVAQRAAQKKQRRAIYKGILDNIAEGEAVNMKTLATRIGTTSQKLTNYMKPMVDEGYLNRLNMANPYGVVAYVYLKTGKELPE